MQQLSPAPLMDLINAFRTSQALFAAVNLGIFDALASAGQPLNAEALCQALAVQGKDVSVDGLARLLRACNALGLLVQQPAPEFKSAAAAAAAAAERSEVTSAEVAGCSSNTVLSRSGPTSSGLGSAANSHCYSAAAEAEVYLTASSPVSLAGYVMHSERVVYPLFGGLATAASTNANVWRQQLGISGSDMFAALYSSPSDLHRFMNGMHSFAALSAPFVAKAFDLSPARTCVDVGGATGAILAEVLRVNPFMQEGIVFDLPAVVQHAAVQYVPQDACVAGRMRWQAGDFWADPGVDGASEGVPPADLYILGRILHDWEQPRCERLLRLLRNRVRPGGAVLLAEMLLPDHTSSTGDCSTGSGTGDAGPGDGDATDGINVCNGNMQGVVSQASGSSWDEKGVSAVLQDLNMMCQTNGRERSAGEYAVLLQSCGWSRVQAQRLVGSYLDAVIAYA